jgi:hypothetical protein
MTDRKPLSQLNVMKEMKKGLPNGLDKVSLVPIKTMNTGDYVKSMTQWRAELEGTHCWNLVIGREKPPVEPAPIPPGANEDAIDRYWSDYRDWQIDTAIYQEKASFILAKVKVASQGLPSLLEEVTSVVDAWNKLKATYIQATPQTRNTIYKEWLDYRLTSGMSFDVWWNNFEKLRRTIDEVSESCHPAIPKITEQEIIDNIIANTPDEFNHAKERIREDEATRITFNQFISMIQRKGRDIDNMAANGHGLHDVGGKRKYEANAAFIHNGGGKDGHEKVHETAIYGNYKGKVENTYSHADKARGKPRRHDKRPYSGSPKGKFKEKVYGNRNEQIYHGDKGKNQREFKKFGNLKKIDKTFGKPRDMANVRCYNCNEMGHYKRNCPNLKFQRAKEGGRPYIKKGYSAIIDEDGKDENGQYPFYADYAKIALQDKPTSWPDEVVDAEEGEIIDDPENKVSETRNDDSSDGIEKKHYSGKMKLLKHLFMEFEDDCDHINFIDDYYAEVGNNFDTGINSWISKFS